MDANDIFRLAARSAPPCVKVRDRVLLHSAGRFLPARVTTEHNGQGVMAQPIDSEFLEPMRYATQGTGFDLVLPQPDPERLWVTLTAVFGGVGARAGWRGLLLGRGAAAMGAFLAETLEIVPDADVTGIGTDHERYWLYLGAQSAEAMEDAVKAQLHELLLHLTELDKHLSSWQLLRLDQQTLEGPRARAVVEAAQLEEPRLTAQWSSSPSALPCACERALLEGPGDLFDLLQRQLIKLNMPDDLLQRAELRSEHFKSHSWTSWSEGPAARYAGSMALVAGAWSTPANTLALSGPRAPLLCVTTFAQMHGEVVGIAHVQERHSRSGSLQLPWPHSAEITDADESAVLEQWSERNLRRLLLNQVVSAPPGRFDVALHLDEASQLLVEFEDFRPAVFCSRGFFAENPAEYLAPTCSFHATLTALPRPGAAFQTALRELPHVVVRRSKASVEKIRKAFLSGDEHVGKRNWKGDVVGEPEVMPLCASGLPEPLLLASSEDPLQALEQWAELLNGGQRPCSLCGECQAVLPPNTWRFRTRDDVLVTTFASHWSPRAQQPVQQLLSIENGDLSKLLPRQELSKLQPLARNAFAEQLVVSCLNQRPSWARALLPRTMLHFALCLCNDSEVTELTQLLTALHTRSSAQLRSFFPVAHLHLRELLPAQLDSFAQLAAQLKRGVSTAARVVDATVTSTHLLNVDLGWNSAALARWSASTSNWPAEHLVQGLARFAGPTATCSAAQVLDALSTRVGIPSLDELAATIDSSGTVSPQRAKQVHQAEQLQPPRPGSRRWRDAADSPFHQALLLSHTVRELSTALQVLLDARLRRAPSSLSPGQTLDMLLLEEPQDPVPPRSTSELFSCGAASRDAVTGNCLPRRRCFSRHF